MHIHTLSLLSVQALDTGHKPSPLFRAGAATPARSREREFADQTAAPSALLRDAATSPARSRERLPDRQPGEFADQTSTPPGASALDLAAERLDLLAAECAADGRLFARCHLPTDAARSQLERDALRLAAHTLRECLSAGSREREFAEQAAAPSALSRDAAAAGLAAKIVPLRIGFGPACAVLRACADALAMKALDALEGGFIRHPLEAAGYHAEASALRYAVAVLARETPATPEQLAA